MNAARDALLDHLSAMGRELAAGTVASLSSDIAAGKAASGGTPRSRFLCERLNELWSDVPTVTQSELALALLSAQRAAGDVAREQSLSIVWTGPDTHVPVRRNDEALYEVIASAERELLVVSFVIFKVPKIVFGLINAVDRGVAVTFVVERHDAEGQEKEGAYDPMAALGTLPTQIRVLEWDVARRPRINNRLGYIHAKSAVADRKLAFVSSANLTVYGLEGNIEMGLLVRGGPVPGRISDQFAQLEARGQLVPVVRP